jgi:hypothetical protein
MVKNVRRMMSALIITGLSMAALAAAGEEMPEAKVSYAADSIIESAEMKMSGKVYVAPSMERREHMSGGEKTIIIVRRDKGVIWNVMPAEGIYMESPLEAGTATPDAPFTIREKEVVGEEVINGLQTTKYKVILDQGNSVFGGFIWITADGITMKMDVIAKEQGEKARIRQELRNVRIGKQDPALFVVPAGYHKMAMGMPDMGSMMDNRGSNLEEEEEEAGVLGGMMKGMKGLLGR